MLSELIPKLKEKPPLNPVGINLHRFLLTALVNPLRVEC